MSNKQFDYDLIIKALKGTAEDEKYANGLWDFSADLAAIVSYNYDDTEQAEIYYKLTDFTQGLIDYIKEGVSCNG